MNKVYILLAVLFGVAIGVGGYHLLVRGTGAGGRPGGESIDPASLKADLSEIRKHLTMIETRLAKVEAKPGFNEVLDDPVMRDRLAAAVVEVRNPGMVTPRPPAPPTENWREGLAKRYRADYARVLDEARRQMKLDEAAWKAAQSNFDKHFAPVEAALKEMAAGHAGGPPKVNELCAPALPETLGALQKAVPAEAWQAFDAWRKADEQSAAWGSGKGDYFLDAEDFKAYQLKRAVRMHWPVLQSALPAFYEKLALDAQKKEKLETALKEHLTKAFEQFKDAPRLDLQSEAGRAKVKAVTATTENALGKIVGMDGLQKFREWKTSAGNRAAVYFGEPVKEPAGAGPRPWPSPGPSPTPPEGNPRF